MGSRYSGKRPHRGYEKATVLVVGSPTHKVSQLGLLKDFLDLLNPTLLRGEPTTLFATGEGERHSLIVEYQLRPLFGFFQAFTLPTSICASDKDPADGVLVPPRSFIAPSRR